MSQPEAVRRKTRFLLSPTNGQRQKAGAESPKRKFAPPGETLFKFNNRLSLPNLPKHNPKSRDSSYIVERRRTIQSKQSSSTMEILRRRRRTLIIITPPLSARVSITTPDGKQQDASAFELDVQRYFHALEAISRRGSISSPCFSVAISKPASRTPSSHTQHSETSSDNRKEVRVTVLGPSQQLNWKLYPSEARRTHVILTEGILANLSTVRKMQSMIIPLKESSSRSKKSRNTKVSSARLSIEVEDDELGYISPIVAVPPKCKGNKLRVSHAKKRVVQRKSKTMSKRVSIPRSLASELVGKALARYYATMSGDGKKRQSNLRNKAHHKNLRSNHPGFLANANRSNRRLLAGIPSGHFRNRFGHMSGSDESRQQTPSGGSVAGEQRFAFYSLQKTLAQDYVLQ